MSIKRCSAQSSVTLEQYYTDLSTNGAILGLFVGPFMVQIVRLIDNMFADTIIYGMISDDKLVLRPDDDPSTPSFVIVSNSIGEEKYYFEYLLPANKQPWNGAYVSGQARSLNEAKKYLLIAMKESRAWTDNAELKRLLDTENISAQ